MRFWGKKINPFYALTERWKNQLRISGIEEH
jgi:hypothetical protein